MADTGLIIANGAVDNGDIMNTKELSPPNEVVCNEDESKSPTKKKSVTFLGIDDTFQFSGVLIEEQMSVFQKGGTLKMHEAIPVIPRRIAIVCLVLNCLIPGLGTMASGFAAIFWPCDQYMKKRWLEILIINIAAGICQLATILYFLIGYFWGIWWGILMVQKSPSALQEIRLRGAALKRS